VLNFAKTLTFKGKQPVFKLIDKISQTGVKLTKRAMAELEKKYWLFPIRDAKMIANLPEPLSQ